MGQIPTGDPGQFCTGANNRKAPPPRAPKPVAPETTRGIARRPLAFYDAVGQRLAGASS